MGVIFILISLLWVTPSPISAEGHRIPTSPAINIITQVQNEDLQDFAPEDNQKNSDDFLELVQKNVQ